MTFAINEVVEELGSFALENRVRAMPNWKKRLRFFCLFKLAQLEYKLAM